MISFEDFYAYFEQLDFVHVDTNAFSNYGTFDTSTNFFRSPVNWKCKQFYGEFVPGYSAGGEYPLIFL